jgi:chorismate mutase-like protein
MTIETALEKLADCRRVIDRIDAQIVALLNERARAVEIIAQVKQECSMPVYEPKREDEVYRNVTEKNQGPLDPEAVKRVFERVIDEMRTLQKTRMQD